MGHLAALISQLTRGLLVVDSVEFIARFGGSIEAQQFGCDRRAGLL